MPRPSPISRHRARTLDVAGAGGNPVAVFPGQVPSGAERRRPPGRRARPPARARSSQRRPSERWPRISRRPRAPARRSARSAAPGSAPACARSSACCRARRRLPWSRSSRSSHAAPAGRLAPARPAPPGRGSRRGGAPGRSTSALAPAAPGRTPGSSPASRSAARRRALLLPDQALLHQRGKPHHEVGIRLACGLHRAADRLGGLDRASPGEHGEAPEQGPLGPVEQVVAPVDACARSVRCRAAASRGPPPSSG